MRALTLLQPSVSGGCNHSDFIEDIWKLDLNIDAGTAIFLFPGQLRY